MLRFKILIHEYKSTSYMYIMQENISTFYIYHSYMLVKIYTVKSKNTYANMNSPSSLFRFYNPIIKFL